MKKLFTLFLLGYGLSASAQTDFQVNGSFDGDWEDCTPWTSENNTTKHGKQPQGWKISHVYNSSLAKAEVASEVEGNVGKAVKLSNVNLAGQNIPAYISLGTPWATAETKLTSVRNADGGTFGGVSFTHHPDAVRLKYKRDNSKGEERASVIAYLWSGSWTQAQVPGNTAVGVFSWGTATKVDMTDRDRNILGKETALGGAVTSNNGQLVASVEQYIAEANADWQTLTAELDYGKFAGQDVTVEKLNIIISANDYFADRDKIVSNNSLTIDDVELVYYHALSALSYDGATLNFDEATTSYDLSNEFYYEDKLAYTKKGQAARVSTSYDKESAVLTIRVEGEDYDAQSNPEAFTEYTVQFRKALTSVLSSVEFNGEAVNFVENENVIVGHIYNEDKFVVTCEADPEAKIVREYDEETGILTVTVTGSDASYYTENVHKYGFQFELPKNSVLTVVTFRGEELAIDEEATVAVDHIYVATDFETVCSSDKDAKTELVYDEKSGLLTVTVTGSDVDENPANVHTYKYQFNLPKKSVLSSVTFDDVPYAISETKTVVIDHLYDADKFAVACEADPEAAIVREYDEETGILTLTVTGSDVDENPANVHTYKYQFNLPFNSEISSVTYAGEEIALREGETTVVDHIYKEGDLEVVCAGDKDAKVEESYDAETGILTVTVTGSDVDENPDNVHTYTFQFNLPKNSELSGVKYNGKDIAFSETETTTIEGCYEEDALSVACEADPEANIEVAYDDETSILTVTVTGSDVDENPANVHTYKFQFTVPVGISQLFATSACDVYSLSGTLVRKNATTLAGLPKGIYVVNGKKVLVK